MTAVACCSILILERLALCYTPQSIPTGICLHVFKQASTVDLGQLLSKSLAFTVLPVHPVPQERYVFNINVEAV